ELESMYDKWMYVLKNLSNLMQRPAALQERVFTRLFEQAEISKFDKQELKLYEDSVNAYRDIVNAIRTAEKKKYAEGRAEGEKKAKERIASNLLALGVPIETIMQASGLSEEEIKNIQ
ncbi:MAG: PD-(D/E)XK nuclease family transposase, partial [Prevotella pectinovora]